MLFIYLFVFFFKLWRTEDEINGTKLIEFMSEYASIDYLTVT